MKVLFLHADTNEMLPEYKVHTVLAQHAPEGSIEPYFVWQSSQTASAFTLRNAIILHDFGRDMSIEPKPPRARRAALMGKKLPSSILSLFATVKKIKPDLIYTSQRGFDLVLARIMAKMFNVPHVVHLHYNLGQWIGRPMLRAICRSKNIIAVSEFTRQTALLAGAPAENVHTLLNPVPAGVQMKATDPAAKKAEIGCDLNTPLVLSVGRLDPGKGHIPLFEAFAQVVSKIPSARLFVCGKSTLRNDYAIVLQQKLKELNLDQHVTLAGHRSDITSLMQIADVFCLPTELDPCPLVFFEAAAEGLPSVAYHSGGVPEIILHGQTGLLSYPRDISSLANNLCSLLENRSLAQQLGRSARKRALEQFSPRETATRWSELLNQFADRSAAATKKLPISRGTLWSEESE
jgi:glycosyltransferase involved in cell wall biosynthesis